MADRVVLLSYISDPGHNPGSSLKCTCRRDLEVLENLESNVVISGSICFISRFVRCFKSDCLKLKCGANRTLSGLGVRKDLDG